MSVRRLATGILAVPLLLSACGGGDDSVADPPISSAPTSSATGTPPRESAEHFIRAFYAAERRMENSGTTNGYEALFQGCKPCAALVDQVKSFYSSGGFIRWSGLTIKSISRSGSHGPQQTYTVQFVAEETKYKESGSAPLKTLPGGSSTDLLTLKRGLDGWLVTARARASA
jgi:hypothetical protein